MEEPGGGRDRHTQDLTLTLTTKEAGKCPEEAARHGGRSRDPGAAAQLRPGYTARTASRTPSTASSAAAANETPPAPR